MIGIACSNRSGGGAAASSFAVPKRSLACLISTGSIGVDAVGSAHVLVNTSVINDCYTVAISAANTSVVEVTNSTIAYITQGLLEVSGGTLQIVRFKNNTFAGNTPDGTFTSSVSVK